MESPSLDAFREAAVVSFAEASASRHLGDLMKEIVAAVGDDDRDTAERVVTAARVLGAHVSPSHWLPIALDHVVADKALPATRASALVILAAMLRVAPPGSLAGEPMRALAAGLAKGSGGKDADVGSTPSQAEAMTAKPESAEGGKGSKDGDDKTKRQPAAGSIAKAKGKVWQRTWS